MDAASKIKTLLAAIAASFGTAAVAFGDDTDGKTPCNGLECKSAAAVGLPQVEGVCCEGKVCEAGKCPACKCDNETVATRNLEFELDLPKAGFSTFFSEWLSKSPKFSAEVAIHFGTTPTAETAGNAPANNEAFVNVAVPAMRQPISKPMKFSEQISRLQLGEFIGDVIICGHRICTGNKCYDVKDEPVAGTPCDKSDESKIETNEEEEAILVLPLAPPAPPGGDIAQYSESISLEVDESEASSILRSSGLGNVKISLPVTTVVDLLVAKTELSTRLEMTSQLMEERQMAMDKIQSLANRNATLATQLAVAEAKNQMSDALTASVVERAELAIKLASVDPKTSKLSASSNVVQTIQEDLSNIRRQIALLRKAPVPFAQSYVGKQLPLPYVPTAQLPSSQFAKDPEMTCEGAEATEGIPASTVK